jgi:adenosine deaminase
LSRILTQRATQKTIKITSSFSDASTVNFVHSLAFADGVEPTEILACSHFEVGA